VIDVICQCDLEAVPLLQSVCAFGQPLPWQRIIRGKRHLTELDCLLLSRMLDWNPATRASAAVVLSFLQVTATASGSPKPRHLRPCSDSGGRLERTCVKQRVGYEWVWLGHARYKLGYLLGHARYKLGYLCGSGATSLATSVEVVRPRYVVHDPERFGWTVEMLIS
jgi:hypothetical protein